MGKSPAYILKSANIKAWNFRDSDHDRYEATIVTESRNAVKKCVLVKSIVEDVHESPGDGCGQFRQICGIDEYRGKRIRMTAWAK